MFDAIVQLNNDPSIHGIIVQMPLACDEKIDSNAITNAVHQDKDVDGLTALNQGKIATGCLETAFKPCTPAGCLELIESTGMQLSGANAVVIGMMIMMTCSS